MNFFSGKICRSSEGLICSVEEMKILLFCPRQIIDQFADLNLIDRCQNWLIQHSKNLPLYSITASPSLLYEHHLGTIALSSFIQQTNATPLFIILLKDPIQRLISLYNHWYLQELHTKNGYSLSLESLIELELNLLSLPYPQLLLSTIYSTILNRTSLKLLFETENKLYLYMTESLEYLSNRSNGRVNLRSFGLILDGFYLIQLIGWIKSNKINIKKHLLIIQSEYFLLNRLSFIQTTLLPFLFPNKKEKMNSLIITNNSLPKIQNIKIKKENSSLLSDKIKKRIYSFYNEMYPIEEYLYELQIKNYAKIIPKINKNNEGKVIKWWKEY